MTETIELDIEDLSLTNRLEKLPNLIREQELKLLALHRKVENYKLNCSNKQLRFLTIISQEKDMDGKAIFKNEDMRQDELNKRLKDDISYKKDSEELESYTFTLGIEEIKLRYLINLFKAARSLARNNDMSKN
jgi:hypothetical protein